MAACLKLIIVVFLALVPIVFPSPLLVSTALAASPSENVSCTWKVVNEELDCNGLSYIYEPHDSVGSLRWWLDMGIVFVLVTFAGISSGLTIGLIGMDYTKLEVLSKSGTPKEQAAARKIIPIVSNHHLLLVTLLLATASAEEAMPLFLEKMMPAWASIIVSVILVLIFAEVIPMALCTRYGLDVGAKLSWLVHIFIWVAYPIAFPISKALDWIFGHSAGSLFKRSQLKELIDMHSKHSIQTAKDVEAELAKLPAEDRLTSQEVQLIKNALDLNARTAIELSTPIDEVYMLEYSQICDREVMGSIIHYGLHFCVPVYRDNRDNIVGMIRVSALIELSPDDNNPISALELDAIVNIPSDLPVYRAMTLLQAHKSSIAILTDPQLTRIPVAVLTMEDIIEELVAGQIADIPLFPEDREGDNVMEEWLQQTAEDEAHEILNLAEIQSTGSAGTTVSLPARSRPDFFRNTSASSFFLPGMRRQTSNSSLVSNGSAASTLELGHSASSSYGHPAHGYNGNSLGYGHNVPSYGHGAYGYHPSAQEHHYNYGNPHPGHPSLGHAPSAPLITGVVGNSSIGTAVTSAGALQPPALAGQGSSPSHSMPTSPLLSRDAHMTMARDTHLAHSAANAPRTVAGGMAAPPFSVERHVAPGGQLPNRRTGRPLHYQQYLHPQQHLQQAQAPPHPAIGHPTQRDSMHELDRGMVELDDYHDHHDPASTPLRESGKWARQARRGKWIRAAPADFETSSNTSSASSNASGSSYASHISHASYASGYSDHFAGTDAASYSSTSSTGRLVRVEKRRNAKDPSVASKIDKKMTVANVVGTALKRSSSSLATNAQVALPIIYKRNIAGDPVVDPSKLLSASYGDIHDIPELNEQPPPVRVLSASHEAIPQPSEEEMVQLDI